MIALAVEAGLDAAASLARIKMLAAHHPGEHELRIVVCEDGAVKRRLDLGWMWTYSGSPDCLRALAAFGDVAMRPDSRST